MKTFKDYLDFEYIPENERSENEPQVYDCWDILSLCNNNAAYAVSIMERIDWQYPETLIHDDINENEIIVVNEQILMTSGDLNLIKKVVADYE